MPVIDRSLSDCRYDLEFELMQGQLCAIVVRYYIKMTIFRL